MLWLIVHMWFLLLCAFALGVGVGWWIWKAHAAPTSVPSHAAAAETPSAQGTLSMDGGAEKPNGNGPKRFKSAKNGEKDDLTQIIGLDSSTEKALNRLGVYYLYQIADWGPARTKWIEDKIGDEGRIERERWVAQARTLRLQNEYDND
ncbi:MAG: hypothetical protein AAGJ73_10490 [Pseudomonadota bacterium]